MVLAKLLCCFDICHTHHVMLQGTVPNGNANGTVSNGTNGVSNSAAWRQETLQAGSTVPPAPLREVDPTLYEELKLGHDGAGFKRLKP